MIRKYCSLLESLKRSYYGKGLHHQKRNISQLLSQKSYKEYQATVPVLLEKLPKVFDQRILDNFKKISECSISNKSNTAGPLVLYTNEMLHKYKNTTASSYNDVMVLSWGADMIKTYFQIVEHRDHNGTKDLQNAYQNLLDASILRSILYENLNRHFVNRPYYVELVHLFNEAFLHTAVGCDKDNFTKNTKDFSLFTIKQYDSIIKHKMYQLFEFPILLAMKNNDVNDVDSLEAVESICKDIGRLYHIQADYLDSYGAEQEYPGLPKLSKDVIQGRCTWLAITALQRCNSAQRIVFTSCYGSTEPAHIERVKLLYDQMQIPEIYEEEEAKMYERIMDKIKRIGDTKIPSELFQNVLETIKSRRKQ